MPSDAVRRMHLALRKRLSAAMGWLRGGLPHERLLRSFIAAAVVVFTAEERAAAEGGAFPPWLSVEWLQAQWESYPGVAVRRPEAVAAIAGARAPWRVLHRAADKYMVAEREQIKLAAVEARANDHAFKRLSVAQAMKKIGWSQWKQLRLAGEFPPLHRNRF